MGFTVKQYGIYTSDDTLTGDAAQAINANFLTLISLVQTLATNSQLASYLPLTGGTVTGAINFSTGGRLLTDGNSGCIIEYQNGVHSLYVGSNGILTSGGTTVDDGNGNMSVAGSLTVGSAAVHFGSYPITLTTTAATSLTLPTSGILATTANLSSYAPLAGPAFTGNPTSTTPLYTSNNTQIATTAFVKTVASSYLPLTGGTITGATTFTGSVIGAANTLTLSISGGTVATSAALVSALTPIASLSLTSSCTMSAVTGGYDGQKIIWRFIQPSSGGPYTVSWTTSGSGSFDFGNAGQPLLSTAANAVDYITAIYDATTSVWHVVGQAGGF